MSRAADVVLLRELRRGPATRAHLAQAVRMSAGYTHVILTRLHAAGLVRDCGRQSRKGMGKGTGPIIWEAVT